MATTPAPALAARLRPLLDPGASILVTDCADAVDALRDDAALTGRFARIDLGTTSGGRLAALLKGSDPRTWAGALLFTGLHLADADAMAVLRDLVARRCLRWRQFPHDTIVVVTADGPLPPDVGALFDHVIAHH